MIVFLNFIPVDFMGGTEKWMNDTAKKMNDYEITQIISVDQRVANIYGILVRKGTYDSRIKKSQVHNHTSLGLLAFVPGTRQWKDTREIFSTARLIYARSEIVEILLVLYFSGIAGLRKTIAGVHAPYIYNDPIGFFDRLHNVLYSSWIYKCIFQHVKKVHVLHAKDENYLVAKFNLKNVLRVPNGADVPNVITEKDSNIKKQLNVLFVGELSKRKGIDILITIINQTPPHIKFTIAGDGYLQKDIEATVKKNTHASYRGYVDHIALDRLYRQNDVLILTSRAESMSLAMLEALSYGLVIIDSVDTKLGLDIKVEYPCNNKHIATYIDTLEKLFTMKVTDTLNKLNVREYFATNFSSQIIDSLLFKNIFEIYSI